MAGERSRRATLVPVALGAALGAPARYGVAQLVHVAPASFPWATFWTNVSGSFALGLLMGLISAGLRGRDGPGWLGPFAMTGFLGAYTTYSTYAVEADVLVQHGHAAIAVAYVTASLVLGLVAVIAGSTGGRRLGARR